MEKEIRELEAEFFSHWFHLVHKGKASALSRTEIVAIQLYNDWLITKVKTIKWRP